LCGSETERDTRRKTVGVRAGRTSLDENGHGSRTVTAHAADRNAAVAGLGVGGKVPPARRERRRTVTDIWPKE
jgi:hypothetical protein